VAEAIGTSVASAPCYRNAVAGRVGFDAPRYWPLGSQTYVCLSAPVHSEDRRMVGVAIALVGLDSFDSFVASGVDAADGTFGVLWNDLGIRLSSPHEPGARLRPLAPLRPDVASGLVAEGRFGPATDTLLASADQLSEIVQGSLALLSDDDAQHHFTYMTADRRVMHVTIAALRNQRWFYGVFTPEQSVLASANADIRRSFLTLLYASVCAILVALALARWISRPIAQMAVTAKAIAGGDLTRRVGLLRTDELGELAADLDAMADALAQRDAELRTRAVELGESVDRLQQQIAERKQAEMRLREYMVRTEALGQVSQALADAGLVYQQVLDTIVQRISTVLGDMCVIRMISADGRWLESAAMFHPDADALADLERATLGTRQRCDEGVYGQVVQSGQSVLFPVLAPQEVSDVVVPALRTWLTRHELHSIIIAPLRAGGRVIGTLAVSRTVPGRPYSAFDREWVQELADRASLSIMAALLHGDNVRRAAELEHANRELEAFSYTVSHDLRAPLRAIDGFSRMLQEQHLADMPTHAQHCVEVIRRNTTHMDTLITDLLALSRLGRQLIRKDVVDVAPMVRSVFSELHSDQAARPVELVVGDLPPCQADSTLLRQVFSNLLSNALKFTSKTARQPRIEVSSQRGQGETIYFVRDNGVGFDMRYADKLFGAFQRLHTTEEYEGTGVGLAIVHRIITRHGGRVWAEASVDQGATFYVALPHAVPRVA
jgi:signal transduction histidine kinase/HAMP domain-containing protein